MNAMMVDNALTDRPQFYTDLSGLKSISRAGRENTAEGLRQVAEQFEALFLNIMMKEMRGAGESLFKDNHLRSNEMDIHQENFDNQLSMTLSDSGGIGLADMMYRQLSKRYNAEEPPTPVTGGTTFAPQATALYREVSRHEPD